MMTPLRKHLWSSIDGVYGAILAHPFLGGLTDGSLDRAAFRHYVLQDAVYLRDYARALAICAAKAPRDAEIAMFCEHAAGAIAVERELHDGFLSDLGLDAAVLEKTTPAPTTLAYTSYLLSAVYGGSFPEAVGAVLPCYWIYAEVGRALLERSSPDPLYRRWIDTYGGQEFGVVVDAVLAVTDRVGEGIAEPEVARVTNRFVTTSRYEWMFWDAAWRQETWPV